MKLTETGLPALVLSTALTAPVSAMAWEYAFGGYSGFGIGTVDSIETEDTFWREQEDRLRREPVDLSNSFIADNGITFRTRIDLDEDSGEDGIDESFLFTRGSFGHFVLSQDEQVSNVRRPDTFAAGGCARVDADGTLGPRVRWRFDEATATVGYKSFFGTNTRGALATEDGAGGLVNPAVGFDYRLAGGSFGLRASYCLDTGHILPTKLSAKFDYSALGASDSIQNVALPYGLGITGVGYAPGVFVNSPTTINYGNFNVDRDSFGGSLELLRPLNLMTRDERAASSSAYFFGRANVRVNSLLLGLDFTGSDQDERTSFMTTTPAFGANSLSNIRYDTSFDIRQYGIRAGLQHERHVLNGNGVLTSGYLRGTLGYTHVDVDADDRLTATGLGGALNINNSNRIGESEWMPTFGVEAGLARTKGNISAGFSIGITYGLPQLDYFRPDSTAGGLPLDPEIDIGSDWSADLTVGVRMQF